jgi:hypothetical protein
MKNAASRMLHAHWDGLRGARAAPDRGQIEPGGIRHILADAFLLEVDPGARAASIRLAGTRICALFGRELRGAPFAALWGEPSAARPWRLVETVVEETAGLVAGLDARTGDGDALQLEMLLLPLRHRGKTHSRIIGTLSATRAPAWIGLKPVERLETVSLRILVTGAAPDLPATEPVRRHGFVVHQGGRA